MAAVETAVEAAVLTAVVAASTVAGRRQLHDTAAGLGEHRDRSDGDVIVSHPVILDIKSYGLSLLLCTSLCRPFLHISFLLTTQLSVSPIWPHHHQLVFRHQCSQVVNCFVGLGKHIPKYQPIHRQKSAQYGSINLVCCSAYNLSITWVVVMASLMLRGVS
jgi:hypothetical protein